jgi:Cu/Ag efflux pump CusA
MWRLFARQSIQGLSAITVFFREATDIYRGRQLVSERLFEVANQMPAGVSAPVMAPLTPTTAWFLTVGITSKKIQPMDLWSFAYWKMRPRLLAVPGVAKVEIYSGGVRQLQIQVQPRRLLAYGLSIIQDYRNPEDSVSVIGLCNFGTLVGGADGGQHTNEGMAWGREVLLRGASERRRSRG